MLKKIHLFHQIRQFYKTFFSDEKPFITKVSDITNDNLFDVLFDINEVLQANAYDFYEEAYEIDVWLGKLKAQIINFREPKHRHRHSVAIPITVIIIAVLTLLGGYIIGRYHTIHQAELLESTDTEYHISYGNEVHVYTTED